MSTQTAIIECPFCQTKNRIAENEKLGSYYRCGRCKTEFEVVAGEFGEKIAAIRPVVMPASDDFADDLTLSAREPVLPTGKRRIAGPALFGFFVGLFIQLGLSSSIPQILAMAQQINLNVAEQGYQRSWLGWLSQAMVVFVVAFAAAFLARRSGILVGLMANSPYILLFTGVLVLTIVRGSVGFYGGLSVQLFVFILLQIVIACAISGGYLGQKIYASSFDMDLLSPKTTFFGIRWPQYFWILPVVVFPYTATAVLCLYAAILALFADYYFAVHPSLWFQPLWWLYFIFVPALAYGAFGSILSGGGRFLETMQLSNRSMPTAKKTGLALLYGIGSPILANVLAGIALAVTYNMPKPSAGDWKLFLMLVGAFVAISYAVSGISWLYRKFSPDRAIANRIPGYEALDYDKERKKARRSTKERLMMVTRLDDYYLNQSVQEAPGLTEFSADEYMAFEAAGMIRMLKDEKIYNAHDISFQGADWNTVIGATEGKIYKISIQCMNPSKGESNVLLKQILKWLLKEMGKYSEHRFLSKTYIWDAAEGNIICAQKAGFGQYVVQMFITSRSIASQMKA